MFPLSAAIDLGALLAGPLQETNIAAKILLSASSGEEALKRLYDHVKSQDSKFSLRYLCSRTGIPSTGNLSDVMSGKRRLSRKYIDPVVAAFRLEESCADCFRLLLQRSHAKSANDRKAIDARLAQVQKVLSVRFVSLEADKIDLFLITKIYAAFGLLPGGVGKRALFDLLGKHSFYEVERALYQMEKSGIIAYCSRRQVYQISSNHIAFSGAKIDVQASLIKASRAAQAAIPEWHRKRGDAHFESAFISVRKSRYLRALKRIKEELLSMQSTLEAEEGDSVIHFNVQIYPTLELCEKRGGPEASLF